MSELQTYLSMGNCKAVRWLDKSHVLFVQTGTKGKSIVRAEACTGESETLFSTQIGRASCRERV